MHTGHSPSGGFIRKAVPFFLPGSSGWRDSLVSGHITSFFQASTFKSLLCVQMVFCVYQVSFCLPLLRTVVITFGAHPDNPWASLLAQIVKNLLAVQETWVQSLGWEDPRGKGMATHSSILVWRIYRQRSLSGHSQWGRKESDTTEGLTHHTH